MKLEDAIGGAILGASGAFALGQVPPFTFLPEEVVMVPAGALLGALLGTKKIKKVFGL